jgi:hypothetical protein
MTKPKRVKRFKVDFAKIEERYQNMYIFEICRELGISRAVFERIRSGKPINLRNARKILAVFPDAVEEVK